MITQSDIEVLTAAIRTAKRTANGALDSIDSTDEAILLVQHAIADAIEMNNPQFKRNLWDADCEVS